MTKAADVLEAIRYIRVEFLTNYFNITKVEDYENPLLNESLKATKFPIYVWEDISKVTNRYLQHDADYILKESELREFKTASVQFGSPQLEPMSQLVSIVYNALANKKYNLANPNSKKELETLLTKHLEMSLKKIRSHAPAASQIVKDSGISSYFPSPLKRFLGMGNSHPANYVEEPHPKSLAFAASASSSNSSRMDITNQQQHEIENLKQQIERQKKENTHAESKILAAQQQEKEAKIIILELQQQDQNAKKKIAEDQESITELLAKDSKTQAKLSLLQSSLSQLEASTLASKVVDINAIKQKLDKIREKFTNIDADHEGLKQLLSFYDSQLALGLDLAKQNILSKEALVKLVLYSTSKEQDRAKLMRDYFRVLGETPADNASADFIKKGAKVSNEKQARQQVLSDHARQIEEAAGTKKTLETYKGSLYKEANSTLIKLINYHTQISSFYQDVEQLQQAIAASQPVDAQKPLPNLTKDKFNTQIQRLEQENAWLKKELAQKGSLKAAVSVSQPSIALTSSVPTAPTPLVMTPALASASSAPAAPPMAPSLASSLANVQLKKANPKLPDKKPVAVDMMTALQDRLKEGVKLRALKPNDADANKPASSNTSDIMSSIKNRNQILAAEPTSQDASLYVDTTKVLFKRKNEWIIALYKNKQKKQEDNIKNFKEFSVMLAKIQNKSAEQLSVDERQQAMIAINFYRILPLKLADDKNAASCPVSTPKKCLSLCDVKGCISKPTQEIYEKFNHYTYVLTKVNNQWELNRYSACENNNSKVVPILIADIKILSDELEKLPKRSLDLISVGELWNVSSLIKVFHKKAFEKGEFKKEIEVQKKATEATPLALPVTNLMSLLSSALSERRKAVKVDSSVKPVRSPSPGW